jgi:hypothetical protein
VRASPIWAALTPTKEGGFSTAGENEERSRRDEREKREKWEQKWKEDDERWERLSAGIQSLLKKVQDRQRRREEGDAGS